MTAISIIYFLAYVILNTEAGPFLLRLWSDWRAHERDVAELRELQRWRMVARHERELKRQAAERRYESGVWR